jgi:DNA polymerase-1
VLALAGDSSDNIPGVKGIGIKTAAQLVEEYGDVEAILAAAPSIKQKARSQRLQEHADDARLSRDLVTIRTNLDVEASLEQLAYHGPDLDAVRAFFEEYELKRLLNDPVLKGESAKLVAAPRPTSRRPPQGQQDMFAAPGIAEEPEAIEVDRGSYAAVCDEAALKKLAAALETADTIGVHVAIDLDPPEADKLVGLGLSWTDGEGAYIPLGHAEELVFPAQLDVAVVADVIGPRLAAEDKAVTIEGAKQAMAVLEAAGFPPLTVEGDTEIASYLLDPEANGHGVVAVSKRRFGHEVIARESLTGRGKNAKTLSDVDVDKVCAWSAEHADLGRRLHPVLEEALEKAEMSQLYHGLELPLSATLARVERTGLLVDTSKLGVLSKEFETELDRLEKEAWEAAG